METGAAFLLIAFMSINLCAYHNELECGDYRMWLLVSLGIYVVDLICCMNQLMAVKKGNSENLYLMAMQIFLLIGNTSWYIYGNVIFY